MAKNIKYSKSGVGRTVNLSTGKLIAQHSNTKVSEKVRSRVSSKQLSTLHTVPFSEKIAMIQDGVSKNELKEIKDQSGLDYSTLSNILSVSRAKLINKKGTEKFDRVTSERILLLADLMAYGQEVFEDKDSFNLWLKKNNKALGGKAPLELMETFYGIQEVKKEIGRIEYGVF